MPSKAEWDVLTAAVGGEKTEGRHLKAKSGWNDNNGKSGNGLDTYGFAALPGGIGYSNGDFDIVGNSGYWWSASEYNASYAYSRDIYCYYGRAGWDFNYKSDLFSVRCLQD